MKGDFTRWTFDPAKHYSRVLSLQGRVFLDADFNEAQELQVRHLRQLAADLMGRHAGVGGAFTIAAAAAPSTELTIAPGTYYVNGIPCVNPPLANNALLKFSEQPFLPPGQPLSAGASYVLYLDVWERYLTYIEDTDPAEIHQSIREVALQGPDTAGRTQVVWQLKALKIDGPGAVLAPAPQPPNGDQTLDRILALLARKQVGKLQARANKPKDDDQPCSTNPDSKYRGKENQLYRVEIHDSGTLAPNAPAAGVPAPPMASYKWSRENGSVIFPIGAYKGGPVIPLHSLGPDERFGLKKDDWVEVVDDYSIWENRPTRAIPAPLLRVKSVNKATLEVELATAPGPNVGQNPRLHPILRRWEGQGLVERTADPASGGYLPLEDGIEIRFADGNYQTSDYWMIPARTETGDVEWPGPSLAPEECEPHGIEHSYAPLAVVTMNAAGAAPAITPLSRKLNQLWS